MAEGRQKNTTQLVGDLGRGWKGSSEEGRGARVPDPHGGSGTARNACDTERNMPKDRGEAAASAGNRQMAREAIQEESETEVTVLEMYSGPNSDSDAVRHRSSAASTKAIASRPSWPRGRSTRRRAGEGGSRNGWWLTTDGRAMVGEPARNKRVLTLGGLALPGANALSTCYS